MNPMQEVEVLRAACCVAGIDGEVTENELVMINELAAKAGVGPMKASSFPGTRTLRLARQR